MTERLRVAIRADASRQIGTGHLRRCAALADAIRAVNGEVCYVSRPKDIDIAPLANGPLFQLKSAESLAELPSNSLQHASWLGVDMVADAMETAESVADFRPNLIIVDHYGIDAKWHHVIRDKLGCVLVAIDDLGDRELAVDILIDHNWHCNHKQKYAGLILDGCKILGGPQYALLGRNYAEAPRYQFSDEVRSIGIFMGGADLANSTETALGAVRTAGFSGQVEVVTTSANANLPRLRSLQGCDPQLTISVDLPDLAAFFARHDLQLGAGGGATWERFCLGAPSIILGYAENHDSVLEPIRNLQIASVMSTRWTGTLLAERIRDLIMDSRQRRVLAANCQKVVDGKGTSRLASELVRYHANFVSLL